jgi:hypothetical protein
LFSNEHSINSFLSKANINNFIFELYQDELNHIALAAIQSQITEHRAPEAQRAHMPDIGSMRLPTTEKVSVVVNQRSTPAGETEVITLSSDDESHQRI